MGNAKWKKFEELVAKVQQDLAPNAIVTLNDKIIGKTGVPRQIDISIRQKVGQYEMLIVIDCKDLTDPVDVKGVEEVMGLFQDVEAHRGVIVAANGFTSTALTRGRQAGLDLYRLIDCGNHDWKTKVAIPTLHDYRRINSYRFRFSGTEFVQLPMQDLQNLIIYDEDQKRLGILTDLLKKKWNDRELPIDPGIYEDIDFLEKPVKIKYGEAFFEIRITAYLDIEKNLYFGYVPLRQISGFKDELKGTVITKELITEFMTPSEIERSWQKIKDEEELAVQPIFACMAIDQYPLSTDSF